MVSRLIASLSGMLSSSPAKLTEDEEESKPTTGVAEEAGGKERATEESDSTKKGEEAEAVAVTDSPKTTKAVNLKTNLRPSGTIGVVDARPPLPKKMKKKVVAKGANAKSNLKSSSPVPTPIPPPSAPSPSPALVEPPTIPAAPSPSMNDVFMGEAPPMPEFIHNAESLDKAIVQKLQSKLTQDVPRKDSGDLLSAVDDGGESFGMPMPIKPSLLDHAPSTETFAFKDLYGLPFSQVFPDTHVSSRHSITGEAHQFTSAESLKTEAAASYEQFSEKIDDLLGSTLEEDDEPQMMEMEDSNTHRSVVYKNRQFSLENSSREALASDSFRDIDMLSTTTSSVNPALFNIPTRYVPQRHPSLAETDVSGTERRRRTHSRSPGRGAPIGFSPSFTSNLGENLFESTMNEIIENGGDEFKKKYSSWVWEAFRSHLVKMKSLLLNEFTKKMQETLEEREMEVVQLQRQYREKLSEFDNTTEGFQRMIDNLHKDNQRVLKVKDVLIEKLKKEFMEVKKHFEQDLVRQMDSYRKEAEVEKLELQKRNDELMMIMLTDASKSGLEDSFKREIESLHKMIRALTNKNEVLHQQLDEAIEVSSSSTVIERKTAESIQLQLEQAKTEITELRKKLQFSEREKEDLTVSHHQQIAKLNRKLQESGTRYDHQLRDAGDEIEALRRKYLRDVKDFRQKANTQEAQYNHILSHMKSQYGSQVEELSKVVSQLQADLTSASANKV